MASLLTLGKDADLATALAEHIWPAYQEQRKEAEVADSWLRGDNDKPSLPPNQLPEYGQLQDASPTNWARLAVSILSQNLYVSGIDRGRAASDGSRVESQVWNRIWQPNRMDSRQIMIHRGALGHGVSYIVNDHGTDWLTGKETLRMRGVSALNGVCLWRDPANDEFPEYAMELLDESTHNFIEKRVIRIWHGGRIYELAGDFKSTEALETGKADWEFISPGEYRSDVIPWVRFTNDLDLDGRVTGEVVPFIPLLKRIDQDTFDRLIVQRFGSWKIRTVAGMKQPDNPAEEALVARLLRVNDLLTSTSSETKFGTLDATPLDGFIAARDADIRDYSSVTQIPPHHLLGLSPNVSAEGLVEAQRGLMQKINERKHLFGESWELEMRLGAHMLGMQEEAGDFNTQVRWEDTEGRSLAQVADALGKLAQMVEIPPEMLWTRVPDWTQQDTERALKLIESRQAEELMQQALEAGARVGGSAPSGAASGGLLDEDEVRRLNRMRGGYGPDWDGDGKPN